MGIPNYWPFITTMLGLFLLDFSRSMMVRGRRVLVNRANDNLGVAVIHSPANGLAEAVGGCAFCLERKPAKWICCTRAITGAGSCLRNQNNGQSIFNITVARLPCHGC